MQSVVIPAEAGIKIELNSILDTSLKLEKLELPNAGPAFRLQGDATWFFQAWSCRSLGLGLIK